MVIQTEHVQNFEVPTLCIAEMWVWLCLGVVTNAMNDVGSTVQNITDVNHPWIAMQRVTHYWLLNLAAPTALYCMSAHREKGSGDSLGLFIICGSSP